jgi:ubiquinone/menaquinone biosynthesis C-methylase UbiE
VAAIFDRSAATYDSVGVAWFTPIAEQLVREIAPRTGERALDIGSGRGAALLPLAEAIGPTGTVTGIDLSIGMVEALRAEVAARGLTTVDVHKDDAMAPDLDPAAFDLVTSSLVLFFLPDPAVALRNWYRLLAPGGRIGVSTFGPQDANWKAADDVFVPHLPKQMLDARTSGMSGPFASDAGVERLLTDAGFEAVRTMTVDVPVRFTDLEQWRRWSWSHGQRAMWEAVPEDRHAEILAEVARALEPARDESGLITVGQQVRYTFGRRS